MRTESCSLIHHIVARRIVPPPPQGCGGDGARRDGRGKGEGHEPALEHFIPPILDPTVNDTRTEVTDRAASYPRGLEPFLEMGLPLVLIGGIN